MYIGYRYILQTGSMIPVLGEDGSIALYTPDRQEIVMTMPAPYMVDQAGEVNHDVKVTLEASSGGYVLTYQMPMQWLGASSRSWPVVLDPVVEPWTSTNNILDHFVTEHYAESYTGGALMCGYYTDFGKMRTFLKFSNIPTLSSGDVLVNATLSLMYLGGTGGTTTIGAHKVNADWNSRTLTWANQPAHDATVVDYVQVGNSGRSYWDITDIARNWYISGNTGIMLKAPDSIESGTTSNWKKFYSVDYSIYANNLWPSLTITYRNASGLESYWDYTANGAGRAGTGYINNYSGNLVWTRTDLGFGGTRMPVAISHIYNANDAGENLFGLGYGWRTNYHQRAYKPSGSAYYVWEDGDGTKHYFYPKDDGSGYSDEDGMELTLTVLSSGVKITDKNGNSSYFDSASRLTKLENNQQIKSSINITYTDSSGYKISAIKDGISRTYNFTYNSSGLLDKISFVGKGSSVLSSVSYSYTNSLLTKVTDKDGKYSTYTYNSENLITAATDVDGYRLAYTYTSSAPKRVASVTEYQVQNNGSTTLGGSLTLTYSKNQTKFVDHNGNTQIAQFNDFGNTLSIQDGEGRAQYAKYALSSYTDSAGSNSTLKANQLRLSSRMQNTVCSFEFSGNFERGSVWSPLSSAVTASSSTEAAYYGSHSMKLTRKAAGTAAGVHGNQIRVDTHSWPVLTFSAYVKTGAGASAFLAFGDRNGQVFAASEVLGANSDWTRLEVSYTPVGSANGTYITPQVLTTTAGTVYVDCVQVEAMPTASRYNLIDNGDNWGEHSLESIWSKSSSMTGSDGVAETNNLAMPHMDASVLSITGDPGKAKYVSQQIAQSGAAGDSYVLAGWACGNGVPAGINSPNKREFGLKLIFNNTDGTKTEAFASFSSNIPTGEYWQYTATPAVAKKAYSSITVQAVYSYQANTVYFDGLQLFKESFGSSYTYDEDGNLTSVIDLQNTITSYEYDTQNNLTKILENNKAKTKYEYDSHHNVTRAITQKKDSAGNIVDDVIYDFEYDAYGNNTLVKVTGPENTIRTTATYTADYNRMLTSTDDLENVTTYCYNENTNVLEWVQYPNDTATSRTTYTYDSMYRIASATAAPSGGTALTADYTYTDDLLTTIETGSTTYAFAYGDFAQRSSIKIGSRTLASYTYTKDQNRYLDKLTYGNGDTVSYDYDDQGRVTKETFEDGSTVTYSYDNTGALATVTDSATGRKTTYYYDLIDRMVKYVESGSGYSHAVGYEYDTLNNLTKLVETINGKKHTTSYAYDYENRLTATTYQGLAGGRDVVESVEYDAYGRMDVTRVKKDNAVVLGSWFQYTHSNDAIYDTTKLGGVQVSGASGYMLSSYYSYDGNGNITRYNIAGTSDIEWWSLNATSSTRMGETYYHYDTANQLVREDNRWLNKTFVWTYDNAGNITSCKEHAFTESSEAVSGTPVAAHTYTYGDSGWGDLLTAYDGAARTYDTIGNLLTDGTWTYTWQNGRELAQMHTGSADGSNDITIAYTYDANGMRTGKTVTTKTYAAVHIHSYTETVVQPTCTEEGYTLHTCNCGSSYQDNVRPALGHHFVVKHPSGIGPSICSRCGYNRGEEYPLPGPVPTFPKPPVVASISAEDDISPLSDTPDSGSTEWVLQSTVVESHSYIYAGDHLIQETITTVTTTDEGSETTTDTLYFTYGAVGPTTVTWNGTTYYYALNAQGDVVGIFDSSGNCVVTYNWDNAWGYNPAPEGSMADTLGTLNPLRYRSYVYDDETGLYYLCTRYYDPEICRFINADILISTGQGILGNNMFAYCANNPVSRVDPSGKSFAIVLGFNFNIFGWGMTGSINLVSTRKNFGVQYSYYLSDDADISKKQNNTIGVDAGPYIGIQYTEENSMSDLEGYAKATGGDIFMGCDFLTKEDGRYLGWQYGTTLFSVNAHSLFTDTQTLFSIPTLDIFSSIRKWILGK